MNAPPRPLHIRGVEQPKPDPKSSITDWHVDYTEAVRVVKDARGWWIFLKAYQFAPLKDTTNNTAKLTEGLELMGNVCVSKREALKYIEDVYGGERMRIRVNVRLSTCGSCLFIG